VLRRLLGVVVGLVAWFIIGTCGLLLIRAAWSAYAASEEAMTFTLPMQLLRLTVGVLSSVGGGWLAARMARSDSRAAWWLGALLVLIFIPIHYQLWDKFPIWYHLTFLLTLAPIVGLSGRTARREPALL